MMNELFAFDNLECPTAKDCLLLKLALEGRFGLLISSFFAFLNFAGSDIRFSFAVVLGRFLTIAFESQVLGEFARSNENSVIRLDSTGRSDSN